MADDDDDGDDFEGPAERVVGGEGPTPGSRARRSAIHSNSVGGLNVETLVVADRTMLEKHGRDNVTTYVLTVMNMVGGWRDRAENHRAGGDMERMCYY